MNKEKIYIAIDLKSFYASVECVDRNLNPLTTNLVVADSSRTEKTICLAVSPSLKAYGISGRARLFEVNQRLKEVNAKRRSEAPGRTFTGSSYQDAELKKHPELEIDYIAAVPRMAHYMEYSTRIYQIYLKYIAPEDIHIYSIDEVFMDVTNYLETYKMSPEELARTMIQNVLLETGITATAGIGTNLYLCKIAMDIVAKHIEPDEKGVRIAYLNEGLYREKLWEHQPLTDFWRVGRGYAKKLIDHGLFTMGDIARCSIGKETDYYNENLLYDLFGINAELLIDHAWGIEPCGMEDIKSYRPSVNCLSQGQVLQSPYPYEKAKIVVREMTELMALDLVDRRVVTDQLILTIGYDIENLKNPSALKAYEGEITMDHYGRAIPKHAHGTGNLGCFTASTMVMTEVIMELFEKIVNPKFTVRRINITANHILPEHKAKLEASQYQQLTIFSLDEEYQKKEQEKKEALDKERRIQQAMLDIKKKYGKNAILRGTNFMDGATAKERNQQIGGHKA